MDDSSVHTYIAEKRAHTGTLNVRVCALFPADMCEGRQGIIARNWGDKVTPNPGKVMVLFFGFSSGFHQYRQSRGPKWVKRRHRLVSMQNFLHRSSRINSGLLAVDVNMSIPGQPSIAHVGTCAMLSGAHFFRMSHSSAKKKGGSSRHSLVTNPKVPCVPKIGSRMTLQLMHINARVPPPLILFHLVHPSTVHYYVIVFCFFYTSGRLPICGDLLWYSRLHRSYLISVY